MKPLEPREARQRPGGSCDGLQLVPLLPRVEGMGLGLGHGSRATDSSDMGTPRSRAQDRVTQNMTQRHTAHEAQARGTPSPGRTHGHNSSVRPQGTHGTTGRVDSMATGD